MTTSERTAHDPLTPDRTAPPDVFRPRLTLFMALAAAVATSTIYPLQPDVADVARSLGSTSAGVGVALACGPVGYLLGLALLVPTMDRFRPDHVLAVQFLVLAGGHWHSPRPSGRSACSRRPSR